MMMFGTFNEWKNCGYVVVRGSKATYIDGEAQFSSKQVTLIVDWTTKEYDEDIEFDPRYEINN